MTKTCGILITDGVNLLICHPTNESIWDIPKGRQDSGENDITTAIRETFEETGLKIKKSKLVSLGVWPYKPGKQLSLFLHSVKDMPDISMLVCNSYVKDGYYQFPEMDAYDILPIEDAVKKLNPCMQKIIENIFINHID